MFNEVPARKWSKNYGMRFLFLPPNITYFSLFNHAEIRLT
jgi:hypothetical protein